MFQKYSRYRGLAEIIGTDKQGRGMRTQELRLAPDLPGELDHAVQDTDRIDHLAYKYYRQSRKWWRICDANPEYPYPLALLGQDAMVTEVFSLEGGDTARTAALLADLRSLAGVEDVAWDEAAELERQTVLEAGQPVVITVEKPRTWLTARYNRLNADKAALLNAFEAHGFTRPVPAPVGRIGKAIAIPRDGQA